MSQERQSKDSPIARSVESRSLAGSDDRNNSSGEPRAASLSRPEIYSSLRFLDHGFGANDDDNAIFGNRIAGSVGL
jgi:hypothetical protein